MKWDKPTRVTREEPAEVPDLNLSSGPELSEDDKRNIIKYFGKYFRLKFGKVSADKKAKAEEFWRKFTESVRNR